MSKKQNLSNVRENFNPITWRKLLSLKPDDANNVAVVQMYDPEIDDVTDCVVLSSVNSVVTIYDNATKTAFSLWKYNFEHDGYVFFAPDDVQYKPVTNAQNNALETELDNVHTEKLSILRDQRAARVAEKNATDDAPKKSRKSVKTDAPKKSKKSDSDLSDAKNLL